MASIGLRDLLEAGVHFGHQTRKWNPKMKPYIFIARGGIYIIDLQKTLRLLNRATDFLHDLAAKGGNVLFVGTKKQAKIAIRENAQKCGMPYVTERWLGGMLTNWQTIYHRVEKMEDYEAMMNDGRMEKLSKKEQLEVNRSYEKLHKNLSGIRTMKKLPQALFVVGTAEEETAVREANKLGIPVIGITDTNADPTLVKYPIPGNDDAIRSINLFARVVAQTILEGKQAGAEGRDQVDMAAAAPAEFQATATLEGDASRIDPAPAAAPEPVAEPRPEA
ncbi:MAG: 30S ribosomal protein S2 [Candidatus Krumholzibacteria bacterium]|nr:30S ribosomal protein S2 [Candidatus Krumholzibacteria bacterium]